MLIEKIAKELGLELDQEFTITGDENIYKFTKDGLVDKYGRQDRVLRDILCGIIKKEDIKPLNWKPKEGETYYNLDPYFGYRENTWENLDAEIRMFNNGFVCKTKEEIIELSEYLIEQAKKFQKSRKK